MTELRFYKAGNFHCGIRGSGFRWETNEDLSSTGTGSQYDTMHRVWVR